MALFCHFWHFFGVKKGAEVRGVFFGRLASKNLTSFLGGRQSAFFGGGLDVSRFWPKTCFWVKTRFWPKRDTSRLSLAKSDQARSVTFWPKMAFLAKIDRGSLVGLRPRVPSAPGYLDRFLGFGEFWAHFPSGVWDFPKSIGGRVFSIFLRKIDHGVEISLVFSPTPILGYHFSSFFEDVGGFWGYFAI